MVNYYADCCRSMATSIPSLRASIALSCTDIATLPEIEEEQLFCETTVSDAEANKGTARNNLGHLHLNSLLTRIKLGASTYHTNANCSFDSNHQEVVSSISTEGSWLSPTAAGTHGMTHDMEHQSLLAQCNGDIQTDKSEQQDHQPEFLTARRATMAATGSLVTSPHLEHRVHWVGRHHTNSNRALSVMSLGSNKDISVASGSQESKHSILCSREDGHRYPRRMDGDSRHQARYASTLTNIGVEYMRATGTRGVRFKQLQKPCMSKSHESIPLSCCDQADQPNSTAVNALCSELPLIIPMNIKPVSLDPSNSANNNGLGSKGNATQTHAGYRLGQRKDLAERRRKIADYSCAFALVGVALMVLEMECTIGNLYKKVSYA